MRLNIIGKTVVKDFAEFIDRFRGVEDWLKKNLEPVGIHWDSEKNEVNLIEQYLNERQGMFSVMKNNITGDIMILEFQPPNFLVTGSGDDMGATYGDKRSVEAAFLNYVRDKYNPDVENYIEAVTYVKENGDEQNPVRIF